MKSTTLFQIIALLSSAHSSSAGLRAKAQGRGNSGGKEDNGGGGRGNGGRGGGKQDADGEASPNETILVEIKLDKERDLSDLCADVAEEAGAQVARVYGKALYGCALEVSPGAATASMATMAGNPSVMAVEEDQKVYASYSWGLDRVDQCELPLGGSGAPLTKVDATGVRVYIVDTGIDKGHSEFGGMIDADNGCHIDTTRTNGQNPFEDGNSHGTHVAGTTCGINYGVATCNKLCAIRVLDNGGGGSYTGVIAGLNHVIADCENAFPTLTTRKCVANLSLGGPTSSSMDTAVQNAVNAGVVMVVAAGNDNSDACGYSPAGEASAITVGSTAIDDTNSGFSNYGNCVDVYAPGSNIVSARAGTTSGTKPLSGTSMASPHVAGIVAGMLGGNNVAAADVATLLKQNAKLLSDKAQDGSDQLLANTVGCNGPTPAPAPTPAPVPCTFSVKVAVKTDNYPSETSWDLVNQCDGTGTIGASKSYSSTGTFEDEYCLPAAKYKFTINDSYGDGICCNYGIGSYEVSLNGGVTKTGDGNFGSTEDHDLGSCGNPGTPPPTSPPTLPPTAPLTSPPTAPPTAPPTSPPTTSPTVPPTTPPTPSPTAPPTSPPTAPPTSPPTVPPTVPPTPFPTAFPTSPPTLSPVPPPVTDTPGPTFFTCEQFNEANGMACTKAYGGGRCQWLGSCRNCGCAIVRQGE